MDLLEVAYGIDLETYTVAWPVGLAEPLTPWPVAKQAAATRFLTAEPGEVTAVSGVEEVRARPGVVDIVRRDRGRAQPTVVGRPRPPA